MIFDIGPFRLYRPSSGGLDISLIALDDSPCGWEYGWFETARGQDRPWLSIRIGKLQMFYFEKYKGGFELWFMGFWVIL